MKTIRAIRKSNRKQKLRRCTLGFSALTSHSFLMGDLTHSQILLALKVERNSAPMQTLFIQTFPVQLLNNEILLCKYPERAVWLPLHSGIKMLQKLIIAMNNQPVLHSKKQSTFLLFSISSWLKGLYEQSYQQSASVADVSC